MYDAQEVRDLVALLLRDAGFLVRTAVNGLEALLTAYEMRPDVIVMDLTMPVLDGIEATRLIKATEATRQSRVIAYTGNASIPTRIDGGSSPSCQSHRRRTSSSRLFRTQSARSVSLHFDAFVQSR
jgi:CheY-like chemotaxis protein